MARKKSEKKVEKKEEKKKDKKSFAFTEQQYQYMIIVLSIVLALSIGLHLTGGVTGMAVITSESAGARAVQAINSLPQVIDSGGNATFVSTVIFNDDLYEVTTAWQGSDITILISKDGKYLYLSQPEEVDELIGSYADSYALVNSQAPAQPPATTVIKSDVPEVKLYVMSYCPYGNVAEEAMDPVVELLGNTIDLKIHYIVSISGETINSLHGPVEANQNIREACIQRDYDIQTFWDFLAYTNKNCTLNNIETCWESAADVTGIDKAAVQSCFETDGLSLMQADTLLTSQFGVSGSPTLMINGAIVNVARTPEAYKQAICSAFNNAPAACDVVLSDDGSQADGSC